MVVAVGPKWSVSLPAVGHHDAARVHCALDEPDQCGTRNALLSLGPGTYLEIIGPDPEQPTPAQPRPFGIDDLKEPRLVTWAAKGKELEQFASEAGRGGVKLGEAGKASRHELRSRSKKSGDELLSPLSVLGMSE